MADIRVIIYEVPRSPIETSYTLYFTYGPPSGPLPTQPATNVHFQPRYVAATHTVPAMLRQVPALDAAPILISDTVGVLIIRPHLDEWLW